MGNPDHAMDPTLTKEYERLFTIASKHAEVRSPHAITVPTVESTLRVMSPLTSINAPALQHQMCSVWSLTDAHVLWGATFCVVQAPIILQALSGRGHIPCLRASGLHVLNCIFQCRCSRLARKVSWMCMGCGAYGGASYTQTIALTITRPSAALRTASATCPTPQSRTMLPWLRRRCGRPWQSCAMHMAAARQGLEQPRQRRPCAATTL